MQIFVECKDFSEGYLDVFTKVSAIEYFVPFCVSPL